MSNSPQSRTRPALGQPIATVAVQRDRNGAALPLTLPITLWRLGVQAGERVVLATDTGTMATGTITREADSAPGVALDSEIDGDCTRVTVRRTPSPRAAHVDRAARTTVDSTKGNEGRRRYHGQPRRGHMRVEDAATLEIKLIMGELAAVRAMLEPVLACDRDRRELRKAAAAKAALASRMLDEMLERLVPRSQRKP